MECYSGQEGGEVKRLMGGRGRVKGRAKKQIRGKPPNKLTREMAAGSETKNTTDGGGERDGGEGDWAR